jgi:hypothetical protein
MSVINQEVNEEHPGPNAVGRQIGESFAVRSPRAQQPVAADRGVKKPMSQSTGSRRRIAAALVLIISVAPVAFRVGPAANAYQSVNPVIHRSAAVIHLAPYKASPVAHPHRHRRRICPIDWHRGPAFVASLIRCAARHWHVPGGPTKALSIAWRESHFVATAYNPSGAEGIYQHMRQYWPMRARVFGFPNRSAFNARANVIVTMRMVRAIGGWAPWGQ